MMASADTGAQQEQKSVEPLLENGHTYQERTSPIRNHPEGQSREAKSRWQKARLVAWCLFGVAWLGPAVWILYSNLSEYVIGGNVWCPSRDCSIVTFDLRTYRDDRSTIKNAVSADQQAHSLLGALQFVAKTFETWFIILAGDLIYTVSRHIAKSEGLPMGFLLSHIEFDNLRWALNPKIWIWGSGDERKKHKIRAFLALSFFLSVVSLLIGPLTAVLLNPSLGWDNGEEVVHGRFNQMVSQGPSRNGITDRMDRFLNCTEDELVAGEYYCLGTRYNFTMDALFENVEASITQGTEQIPANNTAVQYNLYTSENILRFSFNTTPPSGVKDIFNTPSYSPNRQLIRGLANDIWSYMDYTFGLSRTSPLGPSSQHATDSVQLDIQRDGPVIGSTYFLQHGWPYSAVIGDGSRQIRCFDELFADVFPNEQGQQWAKCYRYGSWSPDSTLANLTLKGDPNNPDDFTNLEFYWSDKFAYFRSEDFQPWRTNCLRNFTSMADFDTADSDCHWEDNFNRDAPPRFQYHTTGLVTEFRIATEFPRVFFSEFNPSVASATYSVDVTDIFSTSMEVTLADVRRIPSSGMDRTPIVLNATWALANWATTNGSTLSVVNRPAASMIHTAIHGSYPVLPEPNPSDARAYQRLRLRNAYQLMGLQMLSLVPFDASMEEVSSDDTMHPVFKSYFHRQVWKYGTDERTRKFGIAITIIGCVVVLVRSALVFLDEEKPTTVELLRGAIEYTPDGDEFKGRKGNRQSGKRKFVVTQDKSKKVEFDKPENDPNSIPLGVHPEDRSRQAV